MLTNELFILLLLGLVGAAIQTFQEENKYWILL